MNDAKILFDFSQSIGVNMNILDIGGGYTTVDYVDNTFEEIASQIKKNLDTLFKDMEDLTVIAEPGRFFVDISHTVVTTIIGKKYKTDPETKEKSIVYYLNDGAYGSFSDSLLNDFLENKKSTSTFPDIKEELFKCRIFGPTCDSFDLVAEEMLLPDLNIGHNLYHRNMGAYPAQVFFNQETFNGFKSPLCIYFLN